MEEPQSSFFQGLKATLSLSSVAWLVGVWIAYRIAIALYNISPFHPLSHFPGPKIAAASYVYEAYYDWWCVGMYGKVIVRMHEQYGPIIR
jgi:ABC-type amino acid transport system permease subunit